MPVKNFIHKNIQVIKNAKLTKYAFLITVIIKVAVYV